MSTPLEPLIDSTDICDQCDGVVWEENKGAMFKYLDMWDCECERVECVQCGDSVVVDEVVRASAYAATLVVPACWDEVCSQECKDKLEGMYDSS